MPSYLDRGFCHINTCTLFFDIATMLCPFEFSYHIVITAVVVLQAG